MICRKGCAACCIEISISSPIPGMPQGKPGGVPCIHLNEEGGCKIHNTPSYPEVCKKFRATEEMCGTTTDYARSYLKNLEEQTS